MTYEMSQELQSITKFTFAQILTGVLLFSKTIISVYILSCLGLVELAGGSFSISFANIFGHSIMRGLAMAMEPLCCQAYGAKRWAILTQTHKRATILLVIAAIPIIALWLCVESILLWLGQDLIFTTVVKEYITYSCVELLAQAYLCVIQNCIRAQGITKPIYISAIIAMILHYPITILAITLKLGVKGVALASGLTSLNMVICLSIYLYKSTTTLRPWDNPATASSPQGWRPLLEKVLPSIFAVCLEWWWYEIMVLIYSKLDDPQMNIAAMGIVMQMIGLIYVIPHSLSLSMSNCIGNKLGENEPQLAQKITSIGITLSFVLGLLASVAAFLLRDKLGKFYTKDSNILSLISKVLPLVGLCEIGNFPQTIATGILRGSTHQEIVAYTHSCSFYLIGLSIALLASFKYKKGFMGPWIGHAAAQVSCVVILVYKAARTDWNDQARRAKELIKDSNDTEASLLGE